MPQRRRGTSHVTQHALIATLVAETFQCASVVIDATGLGAAPAAFLARRIGDTGVPAHGSRVPGVEPFVFTLPSKSRLGYTLLAVAGTGRLRLYARPAGEGEGDREAARHRARLLRALESARYWLRGMGGMGFGVPAREGHDDYLMSLALCTWAAATAPPPPVSGVIPPAEGDGARGGEPGGRWDRVW